MRQLPSTESKFAAPGAMPGADAVPATALAHSALQLTRDAIARWSGSDRPLGAAARDLPRISPQARWLAEAQYGLAAWIAHGGFAQADEPTPVMHHCAPSADACID